MVTFAISLTNHLGQTLIVTFVHYRFRIDQDVDDSLHNVNEGQSELLKYFHSISSNRKLILKIFAILLFFVVFFIFFLAWSSSVRSWSGAEFFHVYHVCFSMRFLESEFDLSSVLIWISNITEHKSRLRLMGTTNRRLLSRHVLHLLCQPPFLSVYLPLEVIFHRNVPVTCF